MYKERAIRAHVLHLPRNLHFKVHKTLLRNPCLKVHKALPLPRNLHFKVHKVLRLPRNLHIKIHIRQPCQGDFQQEHIQRQNQDTKTQLSPPISKNEPRVQKSRFTAPAGLATKSARRRRTTQISSICHEKSTLDLTKTRGSPCACHEK